MKTNCIFCNIGQGKMDSEIIYENENFYSIFDINPVSEGHALVIPKKHFKTFLDLPSSLGLELNDCIKKTALEVLNRTNSPAFNLINNNFEIAGQVVDHFHVHIIPRKKVMD